MVLACRLCLSPLRPPAAPTCRRHMRLCPYRSCRSCLLLSIITRSLLVCLWLRTCTPPWPPRPCSMLSTRGVRPRSTPSWRAIHPWPTIGMDSDRYVVVGRRYGEGEGGCTVGEDEYFSFHEVRTYVFFFISLFSAGYNLPPSSPERISFLPLFSLPYSLQTPLMWAAYKGRVEMVSCLLDCGARIDECETRRARTALYLACEFDHAPVVAMLLARGANPTLAAQRGGRSFGRSGMEGRGKDTEMKSMCA